MKDEVIWNNPLFAHVVDKIYVSCIFTKNKNLCNEWEGRADIGGTGYDLKKKLPEEIESIKPKINWGFTTRGCIRKCDFCFVPEKEGKIHSVGDVYDIWDGKSKSLIIMDNNILGLPSHFQTICEQLKKEKIKVDFNQGLDIRLLNNKNVELLKSIKHAEYKFAWDGNEDLTDQLKYAKESFGQCTIFFICGFNRNFEQDLNRANKIKELGHCGYAMRHENVNKNKMYIQLARWVNQHHIFKKMTFEEFLCHP